MAKWNRFYSVYGMCLFVLYAEENKNKSNYRILEQFSTKIIRIFMFYTAKSCDKPITWFLSSRVKK